MNTPDSKHTPAPVSKIALRDLVHHLRQLPAKRRVDMLLELPNLPQVLARLPVQDVYAMIKEVGVADSLELLAASPPRLLQGFLDFSAWRGERIDPRALASFYAALFHAKPEHALGAALAMDREPLLLFLKLHVRVHEHYDGANHGDVGEHIITPDNKLVVEFITPPGLPEDQADPLGLGDQSRRLARLATKLLVEGWIERDPAGATQLLDSLRWELPSPLEEEALRWRNARLEDLGFPPAEEAMVVLAYLDPDTARLHPPARPPAPEPGEEIPDVAMALYMEPDDKPRETFLTEGLSALTGEEQEACKRELAVLCNRVCVARGADPGDPLTTAGTVRETRTTLDLALAYRCSGDATKAADLLRIASLQDLFRVGHSLTLQLQRRAQRVLRDMNLKPRDVAQLLDPPGGLALAALLSKQPLLFQGLAQPGTVGVRPFASLDDLAVAARSLAESAFRLAVGVGVLGITPAQLQRATWADTNLGDAVEVTVELLLTTALAHAAVGNTLSPTPLTREELQAARTALTTAASIQKAAAALSDVVAPRAPLPGARSSDESRQRATTLAGVLLARLADELTGIPGNQPVDPRFITRVLARVS